MKKLSLMLLSAVMAVSVCSCAGTNGKNGTNEKEEKAPPEIHAIAYDESMDTLKDEAGADAFDHKLDHADSKYYKILDYYNMESDETLHILSHFETYQQTTEYSCACACTLMVLNYYGNHDYNELDICRMVDTDTSEGTPVENIAGFFDSIGWKTTSHADTKRYFESQDDFETFLLKSLDEGTPVMVDWMDWGGHWQVIIGLDTIGTDDPTMMFSSWQIPMIQQTTIRMAIILSLSAAFITCGGKDPAGKHMTPMCSLLLLLSRKNTTEKGSCLGSPDSLDFTILFPTLKKKHLNFFFFIKYWCKLIFFSPKIF